MRQIVLDTETTGLEIAQGNRIIEIGCVELVNRKLTKRSFHQYINPEREVEEGAFEVHGISDSFLKDKPLFAGIVDAFIEFIDGAELIIHNAPFDVSFLDNELKLLGKQQRIADYCSVTDSLVMARHKHPGQKNNLDALCKRYMIDSYQRDLHGALLDAEILADVYLAMTGGQTKLGLGADGEDDQMGTSSVDSITKISGRAPGRVIKASNEELEAHTKKLASMQSANGGKCLWSNA